MVIATIVLSVFTWDTSNGLQLLKDKLQTFLICELGHHNSSNPCIFSDPDSLVYDLLQIMAYLLLHLLPVVNLLYVVNIQELKNLWKNMPDI